jgi:hypothetical protein
MTTPAGGSGTPGWRSRAFIQPLLLTVVGVIASVDFVLLLGPGRGAESSPVGNLPGVIQGTLYLAVGLLFTGFVVGLSSSERNLALGAVLAAAILLTLPFALNPSPSSGSLVDRLVLIGGLAILQLLPILLGFGVGRVVKARAEKV